MRQFLSFIEIKSIINNRVRVRLKNRYLKRKLTCEFASALKSHENIECVHIKSELGTILIYTKTQVDINTLKEQINLALNKVSDISYIDFLIQQKNKNPLDIDKLPTSELVKTVLVGGFLLYGYIRRYLFGAPDFANHYLSSVILILSSFPVIKDSLTDFKEGRHVVLLPYLIALCILSILARETFAAIEIIWTIMLTRFADKAARLRTRKIIESLFKPPKQEYNVLVNGKLTKVKEEDIKKGDILVISAGERLPACGTILDGEGIVDESYFTGHARPERCGVGDIVYEGSILLEGVYKLSVTRVGDETIRKRLLKRAEESFKKRAWTEKQTDKLALGIAWLGILAFFSTWYASRSLSRALSVLFAMAFPAEAMISTSLTLSSSILKAAHEGVIVKGVRYLDRLKIINTFCFDKTGTLTTSLPNVIDVIPLDGRTTADTIIRMAASTEAYSHHPVARAIVNEARKRKILYKKCKDYQEYLGLGIVAKTPYGDTVIGSTNFMEDYGFNLDPYLDDIRDYKDKTPVFVAKNNKIMGVIILDNVIREDAKELINGLRQVGIEDFHILSGDIRGVRKVAETLNIKNFKENYSPGEKAFYIENLVRQNRWVAMVGDGLNDSMAFTKANISIAVGMTAVDDVIGYADIIITTNDLKDILKLRDLSLRAEKVISHNCLIAELISAISIIFGLFREIPPPIEGLLRFITNLTMIYTALRI